MIASNGQRVFSVELVKGSKPTDLCRLVDDQPFEQSKPDGPEWTDGFHRHIRVLTLQELADWLNPQIKNGSAVTPLTYYVPDVRPDDVWRDEPPRKVER
jgi:hypothetical protein